MRTRITEQAFLDLVAHLASVTEISGLTGVNASYHVNDAIATAPVRFLSDLAGERRVHETIPILVDKFRIDMDYMLEPCSEALSKIGDPEAI